MRRRPFFLLEVSIATALIGAFAFLSIRGSFKAIGKEHEQLQSLKTAMQEDLDRMDAIEECWSRPESFKKWTKVKRCEVQCEADQTGKVYLLSVKNKDSKAKYHYLVERT